MDEQRATDLMQRFDASGFKLTTGWTSPTAGIRQLQRMDKALRRSQRTHSKRNR
jgi:hypothetical protein